MSGSGRGEYAVCCKLKSRAVAEAWHTKFSLARVPHRNFVRSVCRGRAAPARA